MVVRREGRAPRSARAGARVSRDGAEILGILGLCHGSRLVGEPLQKVTLGTRRGRSAAYEIDGGES